MASGRSSPSSIARGCATTPSCSSRATTVPRAKRATGSTGAPSRTTDPAARSRAKFSLYEGGIRSPAIASWPARIPPGTSVSEPGAAMDLFPTLLRAAGGDTDSYELDGRDVLPVLADGAPSPHRDLFWEMGRQTAIRRGNWKLILNGQLVEG